MSYNYDHAGYTGSTGSASASQAISFCVPNEVAGSIIGAGGLVIKRIRDESGARIFVDPPNPGSTMRCLNIEGSADQIITAQDLIRKCTGWGDFSNDVKAAYPFDTQPTAALSRYQYLEYSGDATAVPGPGAARTGSSDNLSFRVPNYVAGSIIGAGGAVIKRIRSESGAKIIVDPPQPGSNERYVSISGTEDQIQAARELITKCTGWGDFGGTPQY